MRLLARYAEKELGERIVTVNRTAGGNLNGNLEGIQAAPDGYVLGVWGMGLVTDELVIKNAPYTHKDVQLLCMYAKDPHIIAIGKRFAESRNIATLADLVDYVRRNPGRVTFGSGGNWTSHDFVRLKLESEAEAKFVRMPFLGGALAARALVEGNCDVASMFPAEYMTLEGREKVLPLAVTYATRISQLPDLPTTAEAGYPNLVQSMWRVLTVPRGTPRVVVDYLAAVFKRAVNDPDFIREARALGVNPLFMGPDELTVYIEVEFRYYQEMTQKWGIRSDE